MSQSEVRIESADNGFIVHCESRGKKHEPPKMIKKLAMTPEHAGHMAVKHLRKGGGAKRASK